MLRVISLFYFQSCGTQHFCVLHTKGIDCFYAATVKWQRLLNFLSKNSANAYTFVKKRTWHIFYIVYYITYKKSTKHSNRFEAR